jgi:iron complex outermembrane recepter protein
MTSLRLIDPIQHSRLNQMIKKTVFLAILTLLCIHTFAQYTIKGTISNTATNAPLCGAQVQLQNTFLGTTTDAEGIFILKSLKSGTYILNASFLGFESETRELTLNQDIEIQIKLAGKAILAEEIEIQSTRAGEKVPVTFQNISLQKIQSENMGQDMPFLLSNSISAVSTSDAGNGIGYTALRIRGTDMTRINVTINGIPLNDPESHNVYWVDLPDFAASTDNIQVQRGVGTSTNGAAAFGASINLQTTKINQEAYATISSSLGSFRTMRNSVSFGTGLIDKHWNLDGRISGLSSDGYIDRASSNLLSSFISGSYCNKKSVLRFNLFTGKEKTYQAWDGIPHEILDTARTYNGMGSYTDHYGHQQFYSNETDNYNQTHFQALYSAQLSHSLYLAVASHYTRGSGYYEQYREDDELSHYGINPIKLSGPFYISDQDTVFVPDSLISTSDLIRRKWLDNDFAGLTYSLTWNKKKIQVCAGGSWNTYTGRHFGKVIWAQFAGNSETDHEWYRSKSQKQDFNLYIKASYEFSSMINLFADLQLRNINYSIEGIDDDSRNISQDHYFTFYNPKAGAFFTLNNFISAYLSFAMANREPNRDNFVDADPLKPVPKPETLYDFELGHHFSKKNLTISTNVFYMYYRDQLALTGAINDVGSAVMENVPVSYRLGLELSSQLNLLKSLHLSLHATLSRNKIKSYMEFVDNWDTWEQIPIAHTNTDIAYSPSVIAGSEISWDFIMGGTLSMISRYIGKQFIDNTQDDSRVLHSYLVNDLRIAYEFHTVLTKTIECSLVVNNFLNEKYESNAWVYRYNQNDSYHVSDGYFPQACINLMAGITIKL